MEQTTRPRKTCRTPVNLDHVFYYKLLGKTHPDLQKAANANKRRAMRHYAESFVLKGRTQL